MLFACNCKRKCSLPKCVFVKWFLWFLSFFSKASWLVLSLVLSFLYKASFRRVFFLDTFSCFEYIARRRGETFVQATLIDVLTNILKALPLKDIEELILFTIIDFIQELVYLSLFNFTSSTYFSVYFTNV